MPLPWFYWCLFGMCLSLWHVTEGAKFSIDAACGLTKGCFSDCDASGCSYEVTWAANGTTRIAFTIKSEYSGTGDRYLAIGFSGDQKMGSDFVTECVFISGSMSAYTSYNPSYSNNRNNNPTASLHSVSGSYTNGVFQCSFSQDKTAASNQLPDLNKDFYILLARGGANAGGIEKHSSTPIVSNAVTDFQTTGNLGSATITYPLVQAHGSLMVLAWILISSIGIVVARFYKPVLTKDVLGIKMWFLIHRASMTLVLVLTVIAFILIFVEVEGYSSQLGPEGFKKAHPILGIIVTALAIINPVMALFRCHPGTENRPIFNWAHYCVGMVAKILAVITIFFGVRLGKPAIPDYVIYVLIAYVVWQIAVELTLEILQYMSKKRVQRDALEMLSRGGEDEPKQPELSHSTDNRTGVKKIILVVHVIVVAALSFTVVGVIADS